MEQTNLFEFLYDDYKITKPIRLIELFAGYGSQALALKYLGVPFEHYKICEWAYKSIQAYKDIHFTNDDTDYSKELTFEQVYNELVDLGISSNYNEPMEKEQIKRKGEQWCRQVYNNIKATHNLVNISQAKGKDLEIVDTDKYDYIMTYSFPCQDLSLAGKQKGMEKGSGTRSGLLWQVERLLDECKELKNLPKILLMENVPDVIGSNNIDSFKSWRLKLEQLGYSNYDKILNAKDYEIPQNRRRCFMVSILGDYNYTFPKEKKLVKRLKDLLEPSVDEKYYLSDSMIKYISADNEKWSGNNEKSIINKTVASTLNTNEGSRRCDASNYISEDVEENYDLKCNKSLKETLEKNKIVENQFVDAYNRTIRNDNLSGTITTGVSYRNTSFVIVPEATKKGYAEAYDGDGIYINRPQQKRGCVQKGMIQTLKTSCDDIAVVVEEPTSKRVCGVFDKDGKKHQAGSVWDTDYLAPTLDTMQGGYRQPCIKDTINNLRIRKLTPKECFRLMGVKDEDYEKAKANQSDSSLYHLAGDSIVTNVLMAIFSKLI